MQKTIIFDASTLINLTMNGLEYLLAELKEKFKTRFIISNEVKHETIDTPLQIKKFELGALKIKSLLDNKVLELPEELAIDKKELEEKTQEIMKTANSTFMAQGQFIHLIDKGESSCLAIYKILKEKDKKAEIIIAVDERTLRVLCEKPFNLQKILENKLHTRIKAERKNFSYFKGFNMIRSAEIIYVAYKKGIIKIGNGNLLDALLYSSQFKGCSITRDEIEEMKKLN